MKALILDAGALIAAERRSARLRAALERARAEGLLIAVPAPVVGQVWRGGPRMARLAQLLGAQDVSVDELTYARSRAVGMLLGASGTRDVVDASVVLCAREHDGGVVTSDPDDLRRLDPRLRLIVL